MSKSDLQFRQTIKRGGFEIEMTTAAALTWIGARKTGDVLNMVKDCSTLIRRWPFEGAPSDPAMYGRLNARQWVCLLHAMDRAVKVWTKRSRKARKRGK